MSNMKAMPKRQFESNYFAIIRLFNKSDTPEGGAIFQREMDRLSMSVSDEQWEIISDTLEWIRDPEYIIEVTTKAWGDLTSNEREWVDAFLVQGDTAHLKELVALGYAVEAGHITDEGWEQYANGTHLPTIKQPTEYQGLKSFDFSTSRPVFVGDNPVKPERPTSIRAAEWAKVSADVREGRCKAWLWDRTVENITDGAHVDDWRVHFSDGGSGLVNEDSRIVIEWLKQPAKPPVPDYRRANGVTPGVFLDIDTDIWHIAAVGYEGSLCGGIDLYGGSTPFDAVGTVPLCPKCIALLMSKQAEQLAAETKRAEQAEAALKEMEQQAT